MTQINSEKAKEYIMNIVEPKPTPDGELVFYIEMSAKQVVEAIKIAEAEAEERHAKEMQELRDKAVETFKRCCQHRTDILCSDLDHRSNECNSDCVGMKIFINELNK